MFDPVSIRDRRLRILVAEDNPDDLAEIRRLLMSNPARRYEFVETQMGSEVVRVCRGDAGIRPDCVLLDYYLPDTDAAAILAELSRGTGSAPCPVVVLTGSHRALGPDLLRAGAQDYVGKDWLTSESLGRAIDNAMERFAAERRQAAERLRDSEQRLRLAAEASALGIWEWNVLTDEIRWDARMFRIYGLPPTPGGLVNYSTWSGAVLPEDLPEQERVLRDTVRRGGASTRVFRIRRARDGAVRAIEAVEAVRANAQGEAEWVVGTNIDVTVRREAEEKLRQSEERLRFVLKASGVGAWMVDFSTGQMECSEECRRNFGVGPDEEFSSYAHARARIHPDDAAAQEAAVSAAIAEGREYEVEYRVIFPGGGRRWILARGQAIGERPGLPPSRMMGVTLDITERKEVELALASAQEKLRRHADDLERTVAERTAKLQETITELQSFSFTVAHDLKAPLRALNAYSEALIEDYGDKIDATGQGYLRRLSAAGNRMLALTSDLLSYTRLGSEPAPLGPVCLAAVLARVFEADPALRKRADIVVQEPLLDARGHETLLGQVLSNLLDNAIKFAAPGVRPRVVVRTERAGEAAAGEAAPSKHLHPIFQDAAAGGLLPPGAIAPENDSSKPLRQLPAPRIRLWVEDNGVGIDPKHHRIIFAVFERLAGAGAPEGTGIGLAIVAKAVERMGGTCGVESALGQGSRFWIELPEASADNKP